MGRAFARALRQEFAAGQQLTLGDVLDTSLQLPPTCPASASRRHRERLQEELRIQAQEDREKERMPKT